MSESFSASCILHARAFTSLPISSIIGARSRQFKSAQGCQSRAYSTLIRENSFESKIAFSVKAFDLFSRKHLEYEKQFFSATRWRMLLYFLLQDEKLVNSEFREVTTIRIRKKPLLSKSIMNKGQRNGKFTFSKERKPRCNSARNVKVKFNVLIE